jgi:hypothetical protein
MSPELESMLRYQGSRVASGELTPDEFAAMARNWLAAEREARSVSFDEKAGRAALKASLRVLSGN